jgi:hypothetical protein
MTEELFNDIFWFLIKIFTIALVLEMLFFIFCAFFEPIFKKIKKLIRSNFKK